MTYQQINPSFGLGTRSVLAGPIALSVTAGLFFTMQALVKQGDVSVSNDAPRIFQDVFISPPVADPRPKERLVKPEKVEPIPDQVQPKPVPGTPDLPEIGSRPKPTPKLPTTPAIDLGLVDGAAIALVRIAPQYPRRAQAAGIEGWVMVRFDVGTFGEVLNPVVEAAEPSGVFEREALKAITKFKYKPKVVDGRAVPYSGLRYRFQFNLQE